jgi:hypothetical protein
VRLQVFVAEVATNAPVEGAEIELTFTDKNGAEFKVSPEPTDRAGSYRASYQFGAEGEYAVAALVTHGDNLDIIAAGNLVVQAAKAQSDAGHDHEGHGHGAPTWVLVSAGGAVLVIGLGLLSVVVLLLRRGPART